MGVQHWFISDLHIKDINERSGNTLLRFLIYLNKKVKHFYLNKLKVKHFLFIYF